MFTLFSSKSSFPALLQTLRKGSAAIAFVLVLLSTLSLPSVAFAGCANPLGPGERQGIFSGYLIVCNGTKDCPCTFADFITLGERIVRFFLYLAIPVATLAIMYTGFQYITAQSADVKGDAKKRFANIGWGLLWICLAWLVVYTILQTFLNQDDYPILNNANSEIRF